MSITTIILIGAAVGLCLVAFQWGARLRERRASERGSSRQREEEAADERRRRFTGRVQSLGPTEALRGELARQPWASRQAEISLVARRCDQRVAEAASREQRARSEIAADRFSSSPALALAGGAIWLVATVMLFLLDRHLLQSQGVTATLRNVLAVAIAVGIEFLGFTFFAVLGIHAVGSVSTWRREIRTVIAVVTLTAFAVLVIVGLVPLSASRAEEAFGEDLRIAESEMAAANEGGESSEVAAADQKLNEVREKFERSETTNALQATLLALPVFFLAWTPVPAAAHVRLLRASRAKRRAEAKVAAVDDLHTRFGADFRAAMAEELDKMGFNPADVEALFARQAVEPDHSEPQGAISDPPPPLPPPRLPPPQGPRHDQPTGHAGGGWFHVPPEPDTEAEGHNPFNLFPRRDQ